MKPFSKTIDQIFNKRKLQFIILLSAKSTPKCQKKIRSPIYIFIYARNLQATTMNTYKEKVLKLVSQFCV